MIEDNGFSVLIIDGFDHKSFEVEETEEVEESDSEKEDQVK